MTHTFDPNAEDRAHLRILQNARWAVSLAGTIRVADIDPALLDIIADVVPEQSLAVYDHDAKVPVERWLPALEKAKTALHHRMHRRALRLAAQGPTLDDLMHAPRLESWRPFSPKDPEHVTLIGIVTGHLEFGSNWIRTGRLCGLSATEGWARSVSRFYTLAPPLTLAAFQAEHALELGQNDDRLPEIEDVIAMLKRQQNE